jgi:hypothetical protein
MKLLTKLAIYINTGAQPLTGVFMNNAEIDHLIAEAKTKITT